MTLPYIEYNLSELNEHGVFITPISNSTLRLKEEVTSIINLVKKDERYKYFK